MIVKGTETRKVDVEVNVKDILSKLLKSELDSLNKSYSYDKTYDSIHMQIINESLIESYIKDGYNYGHYYQEDEVVYNCDRTYDFIEEYISYLVGLKNSIEWLSSKSEKEK